MTPIRSALSLALLGFTALSAGAQASANPVSDALRSTLTRAEKNFLGSAETMPADKYGYKPTDKNMTFGAHMAHMADFNDMMCALIGGASAPGGLKVTATSSKTDIDAHLNSSFAFCGTALANVTDASLGSSVPFFGSNITKGAAVLILSGDWSDHYAVTSTYLRLNQLLPPTAKQGM
jgi:hypothetical protein